MYINICGKWKPVFLGRQTINGNRCLLFSANVPIYAYLQVSSK